ncbi:MAG: NAD(P)(+) transhydrogenase (Re/Si-specific) subunit beta [Planctomycetota bacterium]|nr:MAG: NAD(P)(+) transhydrogenase (Re/Si-specific) subunit beta [Planctomycetota bacterium]
MHTSLEAGIAYLVATALFIFGLKKLSKVRTARRGNQMAAVGMLLAIATTLLETGNLSWPGLVVGVLLGAAIGGWLSQKVEMTGMPELVAMFNGVGGGASMLVALSLFWRLYLTSPEASEGLAASEAAGMGGIWAVTVFLSILIGSITLTGSLVAMGKLSGKVSGNPILLPNRHLISIALGAGAILVGLLAGFGASGAMAATLLILLALIAGALGVLVVIPIGGADMPVVVSLLNSYSGIAASMAGFVIANPLLITAGALVGASGLILTNLMCKAMNRSLANVLIGGFGGDEVSGDARDYTNVKSASPEEAAMILESAGSVIFIPGYGMAVAQAQHVVKEMGEELERRGADVRYAIHPVAGRMPGHMNVLLAESDVPYEQLFELERINNDFKNTDVAIIVGANDVVNPSAIEDPQSPIAGMPILNAHESQTVLMIKRSLSPGYAGIRNPLFERDNTLMCFGDGKAFLQETLTELKEA